MPQGSVLGPLLFLIYINDITSCVDHSTIRLFADDTCLFSASDDRDECARQTNSDLERVQQWARDWLITFAPHKTKSMLITYKNTDDGIPSVKLDNTTISEVTSHIHLGLTLSSNLKWNIHLEQVSAKAMKAIAPLIRLNIVNEIYVLRHKTCL